MVPVRYERGTLWWVHESLLVEVLDAVSLVEFVFHEQTRLMLHVFLLKIGSLLDTIIANKVPYILKIQFQNQHGSEFTMNKFTSYNLWLTAEMFGSTLERFQILAGLRSGQEPKFVEPHRPTKKWNHSNFWLDESFTLSKHTFISFEIMKVEIIGRVKVVRSKG